MTFCILMMLMYLMHDADDVHADDNGHCSWLQEQ